jgi:hypothetical protein
MVVTIVAAAVVMPVTAIVAAVVVIPATVIVAAVVVMPVTAIVTAPSVIIAIAARPRRHDRREACDGRPDPEPDDRPDVVRQHAASRHPSVFLRALPTLPDHWFLSSFDMRLQRTMTCISYYE